MLFMSFRDLLVYICAWLVTLLTLEEHLICAHKEHAVSAQAE